VKRWLRITGTIFAAAGLLAVVWAFTVWKWQDPFTALFTSQQQRQLEAAFEKETVAFPPPISEKHTPIREQQQAMRKAARRYRSALATGDVVGRLVVPRLGLRAMVVNGTDSTTLTKGPGRYLKSYVPGEGQLVYIAGHRTTYGAPFAQIQRLEPGDPVSLELPYGTFDYRVSKAVVVPADDLKRLRSTGHEVIALQACHPRFFATQRYIVYAKPVRVHPRGGTTYPVRT
jgi:sortase A